MLERLMAVLNRRLNTLLGTLEPQPNRDALAQVNEIRGRGNRHIAAGELNQAERCFREALALKPDDTDNLVCLGYVLKEQGLLIEARVALRKAINSATPDDAVHETYYLLGQISEKQGDYADAERQYTAALSLKQDFTLACHDCCRVLTHQGKTREITLLLEQCVASCPGILDYRVWLTDRLIAEVNYFGVVEHLTTAIALGGVSARNLVTLGTAHCRTGNVLKGQEAFDRGLELDPSLTYIAEHEVGYYYLTAGDLNRGLAHMEVCLDLDPGFMPAHSSRLMTLSHARDRSTGEYQRAAQQFADAVRNQILIKPSKDTGSSGGETDSSHLTIGFLSGDFHKHPVAFFLLDVLRHFERQGVRLLAFSNTPIEDEVTEALRSEFVGWHALRGVPDHEAAQLIQNQRVDILIDLGGHTGENRLPVFAYRPAPIQLSWLGYWASTGLSEIDYLLSDPVSTPSDSKEWFAEEIYRLPHTRLCLSIPKPSGPIAVNDLPYLRNHFWTFGSFQQVGKMTPRVLAVWSKILAARPQSKLRLQTKGLEIQSIRERMNNQFVAAGIDPSRVEMHGPMGIDEYLEAHNTVDVLLDTFPYPGGTTTAFALWMGVPTVTLVGDTLLSRQGAAMMACAGLSDWVAASEDDYVALCLAKIASVDELRALRRRLRDDVETFPLFDAKQFATDLKQAFFDMASKKALLAER